MFEGGVRVYCKGAPDVLFPMVSSVYVNGEVEAWNPEDPSNPEYEGVCLPESTDSAETPTHEAAFQASIKMFAA